MRKMRKSAAVLSAVGTCTVLVFGVGSAFADDQPTSGDVVGVGSDTVQYASDFFADGDPSGDAGYNGAVTNRDMSFFATGDGNGRALYDSTGTLLAGNAGKLEGTTTVVLRQGTKPVARPDGSGDGIAALTADSVGSGTSYEGLANGSINYVRASREPKGSELTACTHITDCGGLHVFQFASDNLEMAKWSGASNAVPLSVADLQAIYTCTITKWNQIPGNSGGSGNTIIPVIPQAGSGTANFFEADLGTGGTPLTPNTACVQTSEEHDPTGITHAHQLGSTTLDPADAIEPFSVGRARLAASGYFANGPEPTSDFAISLITGCKNPSTAWTTAGDTADQGFCGTSDTSDPNQPANGGTVVNAADGNPIYDSVRGLYFIVRDFDLASTTTPFQPGSTKNFAQVLFSGSTSFIAKSANQPLIRAAFLVPNYHDLGDVTSG